MRAFLMVVLFSSTVLAQIPQLTHGVQEVTITVYDPIPAVGNDRNFASGVDFVLWGLTPDTYGPPLPVTMPCSEQSKCNISVSWDTTAGPNGLRTVYARAWDKYGNKSAEASKTFNVQNDSTGPVINITAPAQGASVQGQVNVLARAVDDSGIASMELWINGRPRWATENDRFDFRWNTNPEAKRYPIATIEVRATDKVGNKATKSIQVAVR